MKSFLPFFLFLLVPLSSYTQARYDYIWLSGTPTDDTTSRFGTNVMDFNNQALEIEKQFLDTDFNLANGSICDTDGNLLFYTNGCYIADASHQIMENGEGLNPGEANFECPDYGYRAAKSVMILPRPGSSDEYFIFHIAQTLGVASPFLVYNDRLLYTQVNMQLNSGLGAVVDKNQVVIQDSLYGGTLSAVRHANNEDWWIVIPKAHENKYFRVLLTDGGIENISEQKIGLNPDPWYSGSAEACFSPDGNKYAWYNRKDNVLLFDFDRSTGELSNFRQLFADTTDLYYGGLAFSPNSRYLYVSTRNKLWQFDTEAVDIQASKVLIGEYDGYKFLNTFAVTFWHLQLGPDCRIYMIASNSAKHLHIIRYPDQPGLACGFEQRGVPLPAVNNISQPNFPNYRLGTPYPVCDSNIVYVSASVPLPPPQVAVQVWPNPAREEIHIALPAPLPTPAEWRLYNAVGQVVHRTVIPAGQIEQSLSLAGVPPGLYFWQVRVEGRQAGSGKIVISK